MLRVLLVCSVHRETGSATAGELHWLLERIRPEVIFVEHSGEDFSAFLDGSCGTLESAAVGRYRRLYPVELVPVDAHLQGADLKRKLDILLDRIEEANPDYCRLCALNCQHTVVGGFAYLNSPLNVTLQSAMQRAMRATVEEVGEPALTELYSLWTRMHDLREETMLGGVERFARQSHLAKGVLLVGAAHMQSLFNKLQTRQSVGRSAVQWVFDWSSEKPYGDGHT